MSQEIPYCYYCKNPYDQEVRAALEESIDNQSISADSINAVLASLDPCESCLNQIGDGIPIYFVQTEPVYDGTEPIGTDDQGRDIWMSDVIFPIEVEALPDFIEMINVSFDGYFSDEDEVDIYNDSQVILPIDTMDMVLQLCDVAEKGLKESFYRNLKKRPN